jgi:hypothetical protein
MANNAEANNVETTNMSNNTEETNTSVVQGKKPKKWLVALLLSILLGGLGVDRFYMGYIGTGILKLLTFGGFGIWWLIDLILIATKYDFKKVSWVE